MNKSNEMEVEIRALRERLSKLNSAVLRISSSLDLDTVLREVEARADAQSGRAQLGEALAKRLYFHFHLIGFIHFPHLDLF